MSDLIINSCKDKCIGDMLLLLSLFKECNRLTVSDREKFADIFNLSSTDESKRMDICPECNYSTNTEQKNVDKILEDEPLPTTLEGSLLDLVTKEDLVKSNTVPQSLISCIELNYCKKSQSPEFNKSVFLKELEGLYGVKFKIHNSKNIVPLRQSVRIVPDNTYIIAHSSVFKNWNKMTKSSSAEDDMIKINKYSYIENFVKLATYLLDLTNDEDEVFRKVCMRYDNDSNMYMSFRKFLLYNADNNSHYSKLNVTTKIKELPIEKKNIMSDAAMIKAYRQASLTADNLTIFTQQDTTQN